MKAFVTGATGFMGTHLCSRLEQEGFNVVRSNSSTHNLTSSESLAQEKSPYDFIFHLAAWTQAGDFCLKHPGEQWLMNQKINTTVLDWWANVQPQARLISMGTSCAYSPDLPLREDQYLLGPPIDGLYTYAMTKRMLHIGQVALQKQYGLSYLTLVPSTLYGPGYHTDGRQMHFIFDLIRKILLAKETGVPPVLWGNGHQKRELVHVDNFVSIAARLATGAQNEIINIGAGEEFSIRHFAQTICEIVGYDFAQIQFDTTRYTGATSKCLDIAKLRSRVPDLQFVPLREGLASVVAWFRANATLIS